MASKPSLFLRVLFEVAQKIWAVLFFLVTLSVVTMINHYWAFISSCYEQLNSWANMLFEYMGSI